MPSNLAQAIRDARAQPEASAILAKVSARYATRRVRFVMLAPKPVAKPSPPPIDSNLAFELAVFALAEDLDVPPGRLRAGLVRWQKRCREANITFEAAQQRIAAWGEGAPAMAK